MLLSIWNNIEKYIGQLLPIERLCYNSPSTDVLSTMSSSTVSDLWAHDRRFGCSPIGSNHLRGFSDVNPTEGVYLIEVYCTITLPRARKGHFSFQENHYLLHDLFFHVLVSRCFNQYWHQPLEVSTCTWSVCIYPFLNQQRHGNGHSSPNKAVNTGEKNI